MGGSSIFFTSMATGMILSVSWGTREMPGETEEAEEEPDSEGGVKATANREAEPIPTPLKEKESKRTEFEVNG
jgi:hypothetical protein